MLKALSRLLAAAGDLPLLGFFQFPLLLFKLRPPIPQPCPFHFQLISNPGGCRELLAERPGVSGDLSLRFGNQPAGTGHHRSRKSELPSHVDSAAVARNSLDQPVGGTKVGLLELNTGIDHPLGLKGISLEPVEVGGDHRHNASGAKFFQDGGSQGGPLGRIGARPQLVEQHQRRRPGFLQNAANLSEMGGKRAQVVGHGLSVADIGVNPPEQANPGRSGRHGDSRKRHQGQHADGLQGDRLPAGIGTADHQDLATVPQVHGNGNDLPSLLLQVNLQQRVASLFDLKNRVRVDLGKDAMELPAEASLGKAEIEDAH